MKPTLDACEWFKENADDIANGLCHGDTRRVQMCDSGIYVGDVPLHDFIESIEAHVDFGPIAQELSLSFMQVAMAFEYLWRISMWNPGGRDIQAEIESEWDKVESSSEFAEEIRKALESPMTRTLDSDA